MSKNHKTPLPSQTSGAEFSLADYQRLVELEVRDLSDAEFTEYVNLCDRFGDASEAVREKVEKQYHRLSVPQHNVAPTPANNTTSASHPSAQSQGSITQTTGSYFFPVIFLGLFVMVGLGFLIFLGIMPLVQDTNLVPVTATVESVGEISTNRGPARAKVLVTYEFQGKSYTEIPLTTEVSNIAAPGKMMTIYVNVKNPQQIRASKNAEYALPTTIIAGCFVGFSLLMQIRLILQAIKAKKWRQATK